MRSLSNPEWAQLMQDYGATISGLNPGQSMVISPINADGTNTQYVLVYIGQPQTGPDGNTYQNVFASDVTDAPQLAQIAQAGYGTTDPQTWLDELPQATLDSIAQAAATAGTLLNQGGQALSGLAIGLAKTIGAAAGALTAPLVQNFSPILIAALVILGVMYLPKTSKG